MVATSTVVADIINLWPEKPIPPYQVMIRRDQVDAIGIVILQTAGSGNIS
jgi:hypothetical protein